MTVGDVDVARSALTVAGMVAAAALVWFAVWLVWPLSGLRLSDRIWRRLGRIELWWWEWRDRRNRKDLPQRRKPHNFMGVKAAIQNGGRAPNVVESLPLL